MGEVIDFTEQKFKRQAKKFVEQISSLYDMASELSEEYSQLLSQDPKKSIEMLPIFIKRLREVNPEPGMEALSGGPNQDWIAPLFNVLGGIYPFIERDARKEGLIQCLNYLDGLRYDYSQNHVELIHEPWLVGDILVNRNLYWCGFKRPTEILAKSRTWKDFLKNKGESDFFLTLAITCPEYSSLEVRKNFYKEFPEMLDRTEDGIAALTYENSENESKKTGEDIQLLIDRRMIKYDPLLHNDIRRKIEERKWIKLEK